MANTKPLVAKAGQVQQFVDGDVLYYESTVASGTPVIVFQVVDTALASLFEISLATTASLNFFMGVNQATGVTTGVGNFGIGFEAGKDLVDGDGNVMMGPNAGMSITSGDNNWCVGSNAGMSITTGSQNFCMGSNSGDLITTSNSNVCVGSSSGTNLQGAAANNFCLGTNSGATVTTGSGNIFIGSNAGNNASQLATAANTVSIGGSSFTGGSTSIAIGAGANTTAANSIAIGNSATAGSAQTVIGHAATTATFLVGGLTVNDGGLDADTRFEGNTLPFMFFMDASAATENIALVTTAAPNWQTMDRGLFIGDSSTAPTGNPSAGHFYYSNGGVPTFRTSGGAIINLDTSPAYTPTNVTTDRSYDANATTLDELADVVGTLIADLQARALLG
jgi:hypothetical protein